MKETRVIAIVCLKGGVAKTTSVVNIAISLANFGKKVLIIDSDPNCGATFQLSMLHDKTITNTISDVLINPSISIDDATYQLNIENLWMLPSTPLLAQNEDELFAQMGREHILWEKLSGNIDTYDFVLMDSPPSSLLLITNVLRAAHELLIPFQVNYMGIEVIDEVNKLVQKIQRRLNPGLRALKYFGTMYDARTKVCQESIKEMREKHGDLVCQTLIPRSTQLAQAPRNKDSLLTSSGALAYIKLTQEIFSETLNI